MTEQPLSEADLAALRAYDTPTICNAIELVVPERRSYGFTTRSLHCIRPELPPMVGYARTVSVRAFRPSSESAEAHRSLGWGSRCAKNRGVNLLVIDQPSLADQLIEQT